MCDARVTIICDCRHLAVTSPNPRRNLAELRNIKTLIGFSRFLNKLQGVYMFGCFGMLVTFVPNTKEASEETCASTAHKISEMAA